MREKEKKMDSQLDREKMNDQKALQVLRREDFTEEEIRQLRQLRSTRTACGEYFTDAEYHRLAFVRWLVATGKLSD